MRALFQIPRNPPPKLDRNDCPLLKQFVANCLIKDFECRPNAAQLLNHPAMLRGAEYASIVRIGCKNLFTPTNHSVMMKFCYF